MKVLIFSLTYFPHVGGAEVAVKEITNRIEGMEFDLICARLDKKLPKQEKIGNVNVYRVGWGCKLDKYLYPILANWQARKLNKKQNYQIVQAIMAMWGGIAALIFKWINPQTKYLLTMQSGDTDEFIQRRTWFWAPIYAQVYREADYIQAISQYLARRARRFGYKGKIEVIPNGVNIERFSKQHSEAELAALRESLGIKKDDKVVITVSRLVEKNDVESIVKAMALIFPLWKRSYVAKGYGFLRRSGYEGRADGAGIKGDFKNDISNIKLLIIGSGKEEKKLKRLAICCHSERSEESRNSCTDFQNSSPSVQNSYNIIFLGAIRHEDLPKYLQASDVFVRPSLSEGLGNAFLEAMLCGLPIIGTPVGGIVDFLRDGETGLFCEVKNPQSIAEKIILLLQNNDLCSKLSANGKAIIKEKYNWNKIAENLKNIYKIILK